MKMHMRLSLVSGPAAAVTLTEAKAHVRFDSDAEDSTLQIYLDTAIAELDGQDGLLRRSIGVQTWKATAHEFPCWDILEIPLPPLQSVTHIKYRDLDGALQTFDAANYEVVIDGFVGYVKLKPTASWPATQETETAIEITFVAGYDEVPGPLKSAILLRFGELFHGRGDVDGELASAGAMHSNEKAIQRLISRYKVW